MTAYELRISDGSSDVCSSDLNLEGARLFPRMRKERQRKGGKTMSQPFSRFLHPFDVSRHPSLEPEVKRAILASWASDRCAVRTQPALSSEERRVGKECVSTCRCRWAPDP